MAQIEFARDVIFHRRARLHDLFQRAVEIGVALGGATQTRHLFGRRINCRYHGKLETILERRDEGFPVLRAYYKSSPALLELGDDGLVEQIREKNSLWYSVGPHAGASVVA